jgi:hypothetical protein
MTETEPFWTHDRGTEQTLVLDDAERSIWVRAHVEQERYDWPQEILPFEPPPRDRRVRTYVLAELYAPTYEYVATVQLGPQANLPPRKPGEPDVLRGRITEAGAQLRERNLAKCQAWYYPEVGAILLWEVFPCWANLRAHRHGSTAPKDEPAKSAAYRTLWTVFESFLVELVRATRPRVILTPHWEPEYSREAWHAFLRQLGYAPTPIGDKPGPWQKRLLGGPPTPAYPEGTP